MIKKYIAQLNTSELTDAILAYFKTQGIEVLKHYANLDMLHISCDDSVANKHIKYITIIEEEQTFHTTKDEMAD